MLIPFTVFTGKCCNLEMFFRTPYRNKINLMKKLLTGVSVAALFFLIQSVSAQTKTNTAVLKQASVVQAQKEKQLKDRIVALAKERNWDLVIRKPRGGIAILTDIDGFGNPVYTATDNNFTAAATIGTNQLYAGGSLGLSLSGSSNNVKGKLAVWDGGGVRATHVELAGRVTQKDAPAGLVDHATHVSGTLIASGVNPLARGMSYGQQELIAYDFNGDNSEMLGEASNLLISSHSYGLLAGWVFNNRWEWYGPVGSTEDFQFGYYDTRSQMWDSISWNAPNYLIVKSAGNKRDENGPAVGQPYFRRDGSGNFVAAGNRLAGMASNDGYDIIPAYGNAKNILTVGAVTALPGGYHRPQDVNMSSFSSWGPTDDGRIKPDVVADGVDLLSTIATNDNAYDIYSGTSMATPTVAGSALLLQEYWNNTHAGQFIRSSTVKGLIIHTANEAGLAPGPDYQFGFGLVNIAKAASVITGANAGNKFLIQQNVLSNAGVTTIPVIASGDGTITATLCWTDPKATVEPAVSALNNPTSKLVHDLDIVIKKGATNYFPWTLAPSFPDAAAVRGNNSLDNVEKIEVNDVVPGEAYTIEITHKGTLQRGSQVYSLIVSGVGGVAYCASNATNSAGSKIDSVSFATTQKKNIAGCTTYNSYTSLAPGAVEPGTTIPFFVRLRSCDVAADKVVKIFIDANNDGDFTDAGEEVATSGVLNGDQDYTPNIIIPAALVPGKYTILRVVMVETNSAAAVTPCGTYTKGETQDYRIFVANPSSDVGITELVSPDPSDCGLGTQYVSVRINNFGNQAKTGIPVTVVVKQGAGTIATINGTYPGTIEAGDNVIYTLQTPFGSVAGTTYTITSSTTLAGDQSAANNQNVTTVAIKANEASPTGTATVCSSSNNVILQAATVTGTEVFTWYTSAAATTPIASGSNTSTTTSAATYYLGKNEVSQHLGPASKMAFANGGYLQLGNPNPDGQLRAIFKTSAPTTIETARMYVAAPGTVLFRLVRLTTDFDYLNGDVEGFYWSDHPIEVYASAPNPPPITAPPTPNNDPLDLGNIYRLNINIPEAGTWAIIVESTGTSALYRNRDITSPTNYPYSIPGIITLEGNGAVDSVNVNYNKGFYYFWYDMAVKVSGCTAARAAIVPTTPVAPSISVAGNVFTSTAATGNQWYKDGVLIPGEIAQTFTATADGSYTARINVSGCTLISNAINFVFTAVQNVDPSQIGLIVAPVPARGRFRMQLETRTKADLDISLISTNGQQVYHKMVHGFIGQYSDFVEPGKAAAGVYYLRVVHDKKMYIRKVIMVE
jgi:hypothetical protein